MMSFETDAFHPRHSIGHPYLSDVVRLRRRQVLPDDVLQSTGKDFAIGVARQTCGLLGGQGEDDRSGDVGRRFGRHPAIIVVVVVVVIVVVVFVAVVVVLLFPRSSQMIMIIILSMMMMTTTTMIISFLALSFLDRLVTFEDQSFDHWSRENAG